MTAGLDVELETEADESEPEHEPIRRGRRLGRYVLCYELASGGMATVYLGRAEGAGGFGKLVAIKLIHPHLAKRKEFVEMFLDEARLASRVVHPNVCSVFDFGEQDGTFFLAMDYLVGENAAKLLRVLAKTPDVANRIGMPVVLSRVIADAAEGLHAAHEAKDDDGNLLELVHRDVTPQNIFVGYDGSVRIVDFGVAKALGRSHETTAGTLKGKYPYMSPEQLKGAKLDRRSDVWSLGVCAWELLTRRRLFARESELATMRAVTEGRIPPPSEFAPGCTAAIDAVILRALERDRDKRYATAREFGRELSSAIQVSGGASAADVAELMDELFAQARVERAALIEKARRIDPEVYNTSIKPIPISDSMFGPPSNSRIKLPSFTNAVPNGTRFWAGLAIGLAVMMGTFLYFRTVAPGASATDSAPPRRSPEPTASGTESTPNPPAVPVTPLAAPVVPSPVDATASAAETPTSTSPSALNGAHTKTRTPRRTPAAAPVPSAAPAPSSSARGVVAIVTPPGWSEVFVDGARVGRTPMEARLPVGRHSVRLLPFGNEPAITRSIDVSEGSPTRLVVRLEP
jgi:eukaryotic-like serine/threonine-protein kinase